jgi:soluble lytic murein transglycosylase
MRRFYLLSAILVLGIGGFAAWILVRTSCYDEMIDQAAARNGLDFHLVKSLVFEESWFRPEIRGSAGEIGLMQVSMGAASDFCTRKGFFPLFEDRLLEPELNLEVGCWYLRQSLDRYKNTSTPAVFALLRYNAGQTRADAWLKEALAKPVPAGITQERYFLSLVDLPKTREYVRRILQRSRSRNYWY